MKQETMLRLSKAFKTCPSCDADMFADNVVIDESAFKMKCKCGWRLKVSETKLLPRPKAELNADSTKTCGRCHKELPATSEYFVACKKGMYGLRSVCRACDKEYRDMNKEKKNEYNRMYREKQLLKND